MRQTFGRPRRKRGCLLIPLGLLILIVILVRLVATPVLTAAGAFLIQDDGPSKADAIVVLGGDRYGDRTVQAANLVKQGYAPVVYVSGPARLMGYESGDEVSYAEQQGFPAEIFREVHLPQNVSSTQAEVHFLGPYLAGQGVKSILLVTSNFHTRRAEKLWRKESPAIPVRVIPSADPFFTAGGWWKSREGQKTFVNEWAKTISILFGV